MSELWNNWMNQQCKTALDLWHEQDFFILEELMPEDVFNTRGSSCIELLTPEIIITVIELRILFDSPMTVNNWKWGGLLQHRGFRPISYYISQGKSLSYSQHIRANAIDSDVRGATAEECRQDIRRWKREGKLKHLTGIEKGVTWLHTDCRICSRLDEDGLFTFSK